MILGYIDTNPKNISAKQQKTEILNYVKSYGFEIDSFVEGSSVSQVCKNLNKGKHIIIVANIVSLGTTMNKIQNELALLSEFENSIATAEEQYFWTHDDLISAPNVIQMVINLRSSMVSVLTRRALTTCKEKGIKLGRKGRLEKRILDDKIKEIIALKAKNVTNAAIARRLNVSSATLYNFYTLHPELNKRSDKANVA